MNQMDRLITAVKENPEGVLLLGAAVALILRKTAGAGDASEPGSRRKRATQSDADLSSAMRDYAAEARDRAADYADAAKKQASRTLKQTKKTAKRFADNQPLGLAFGGLAAGVMLAAMFPPTEIERDVLGPLGQRAADMADEAKAQVKDVAQAVGAEIKEAAEEGMADAARQFSGNPRSANE